MRWYQDETQFCIKIAFYWSILMWMFETDFSGSMDYIFDQFIYFTILMFLVIFAMKILFKKHRNQNMFPKQLYQGALRGNSKGRWNREDLKRYGLDKKRKRRRRRS
jgi:hypothetical protein